MGLAAYATVWFLLAPAARIESPPTAVVYQAMPESGHATEQVERLVAELLRPESLIRAVEEAGLEAGEIPSRDPARLAEWARDKVRIDFGATDRTGNKTLVVHWTGEAGTPGAGRLVHTLARRLAVPPSADLRGLQAQLDAAHAEASAAQHAVALARQRFEQSLRFVGHGSAPSGAASTAPVPTRHAAPAEAADHADWFLARQQLAELENRRQALADRLMPEHPEMKALDEKTDVLRAALNNQPTPAVEPDVAAAVVENVDRSDAGPLPPVTAAEIQQLGQAMFAAQDRRDAAIAAERACERRWSAAHSRVVTEIEVVGDTPHVTARPLPWQRWTVATMTAVAIGGLVLATWPDRRRTFHSVEEVRSSTRLPVVVIDRVTLN